MKNRDELTPDEDGTLTPEGLFGSAIRGIRESAGWSQDQIAKDMNAVGFSWRQTTVAKVEAAKRPVRLDEAVALARILACDLSALIDPDPVEREANTRWIGAQLRLAESSLRLDAAAAAHQVVEEQAERTRREITRSLPKFNPQIYVQTFQGQVPADTKVVTMDPQMLGARSKLGRSRGVEHDG